MKKELLRALPKVDKLLFEDKLQYLKSKIDYYTFLEGIKKGIEYYRECILLNEIQNFNYQDVVEKIIGILEKSKENSLRTVINGTGTIIHTNLGRSILSEKIVKNIETIALNYNNLEYDLENGGRGSRYSHLEKLICKVTGAEGALVVNNNASAVILALNELGKGKETIISRGELVEIGGSFRIPDIMELSGTTLVEIGTTNRTHLWDYEEAITENTGILLKVHSSNYKMSGFVKNVSTKEIGELGKTKNVITIEDIGSGVLIDFSKYGVTKEPTVQESLKDGIDLVMFSGDKLLGGIQAGIIVGKKELIARLSKNQYLRAFRMNKLSIAALESIFRYYLDEREAIKNIPTLKMILESSEIPKKRGENLLKKISELKIVGNLPKMELVETQAKIGGGSMPEETVTSYGISIEGNPNSYEEIFRKNTIPIIGRIYQDKFVIDMKTVQDKEVEILVEEIIKILSKK